jgi:hypothetical protein
MAIQVQLRVSGLSKLKWFVSTCFPLDLHVTDQQYPQRNPRDVPACVKALLVAIKQLQLALGRWSIRQLSDTQVSDFYVQFGTEFNATIIAFAWYGIDMR